MMLEDEKVVGYGYVTGYYASEVGGMCMFMEEMYFTPECGDKGYGTKAYHWIVDHYPEYKQSNAFFPYSTSGVVQILLN